MDGRGSLKPNPGTSVTPKVTRRRKQSPTPKRGFKLNSKGVERKAIVGFLIAVSVIILRLLDGVVTRVVNR